jgi:membrane protein
MRRLFLSIREAGLRFSRDGCAFLAQAVAFNSLFALFPLVVIAFTVASLVFPQPEGRLLGFIDNFAPNAHQFVQANIQTYNHGRGISSAIAAVFLIWSGKNLFMALTYALDRALGVPKGRPLLHDIALSIVMLPAMGVLLVLAMALPMILQLVLFLARVPDGRHIGQVAAYLLSLAIVFLVTATLYAFLPNRKLSWHFGVPGATFVACIWPLVQFAFAQYTLRVDFTQIYGALSAPLVLLLWFYLLGCIFLYGAEYSTAWAAEHGSVKVPRMVDTLAPVAHQDNPT